MRSTHKFLILAAMAASTSWLTGCFLGSDNSGPSAEAVKSSDSAAEKASASLQTSLEHMTDMEQFQYGKEDLTTLRASREDFGSALRINPGNSKARLGMALTGVLLAAQDPKLANVINRTLDNKSPFDVSLTENAAAKRADVLRKVAEAATWPEFHEIQNAIGDVMLPALDEAITHLNAVYQDPAFVLSLTLEGETREIDHAEAGILLAGVHAMRALLTMYLSYDIDVDYNGSYNYIQTLSGLDTVDDFNQLTPDQRDGLNKLATILAPSSPFLAVRPAWAARLAGVDDEIKSALGTLKESMASIDIERDPQADDLLHICDGSEEGLCIDRDAYDNGRMVIDSASKYMDQPYVLEIPELDTVIKVNFAAYFGVQDFKKLLPYYGFYDANDWSEAQPVLFFTDSRGVKTGNIMDLIRIAKDAEADGSTPAQVIAQLRQIIHLQDPTFQGFLPGATEAGVWNLILRSMEADQADQEEGDYVVYKRGALSTLRPNFALSLLGK